MSLAYHEISTLKPFAMELREKSVIKTIHSTVVATGGVMQKKKNLSVEVFLKGAFSGLR